MLKKTSQLRVISGQRLRSAEHRTDSVDEPSGWVESRGLRVNGMTPLDPFSVGNGQVGILEHRDSVFQVTRCDRVVDHVDEVGL
jgi:hypothetical protein